MGRKAEEARTRDSRAEGGQHKGTYIHIILILIIITTVIMIITHISSSSSLLLLLVVAVVVLVVVVIVVVVVVGTTDVKCRSGRAELSESGGHRGGRRVRS